MRRQVMCILHIKQNGGRQSRSETHTNFPITRYINNKECYSRTYNLLFLSSIVNLSSFKREKLRMFNPHVGHVQICYDSIP